MSTSRYVCSVCNAHIYVCSHNFVLKQTFLFYTYCNWDMLHNIHVPLCWLILNMQYMSTHLLSTHEKREQTGSSIFAVLKNLSLVSFPLTSWMNDVAIPRKVRHVNCRVDADQCLISGSNIDINKSFRCLIFCSDTIYTSTHKRQDKKFVVDFTTRLKTFLKCNRSVSAHQIWFCIVCNVYRLTEYYFLIVLLRSCCPLHCHSLKDKNDSTFLQLKLNFSEDS